MKRKSSCVFNKFDRRSSVSYLPWESLTGFCLRQIGGMYNDANQVIQGVGNNMAFSSMTVSTALFECQSIPVYNSIPVSQWFLFSLNVSLIHLHWTLGGWLDDYQVSYWLLILWFIDHVKININKYDTRPLIFHQKTKGYPSPTLLARIC